MAILLAIRLNILPINHLCFFKQEFLKFKYLVKSK